MLALFCSGASSLRSTARPLVLALVASSGTLFAAESTVPRTAEARKNAAEAFLEEALIAEVDGRGEDRAELLAKAEALAPDLPAIQWQRGMVLVDGKWMPAEDVAVSSEDRAVLKEYVAKRDASENTLPGQLALAKWCQGEKLFEQERAHLVRVLMLDPNHETARARLGFVRADDEWVSREEMAEEARAQASIKKYGGSVHDLARCLGDDDPTVQERASERVRAMRDAEMIPALETLIAPVCEEASLAVVAALSEMPEKEASVSLARFAALSPSYSVRRSAREVLKEREWDHFVPAMLSAMRAPVEARCVLDRRLDAMLTYREMFYRKGRERDELTVNDVVYADSQPSKFPRREGRAFVYGAGSNFIEDERVAIAAATDSAVRRAMTTTAVAHENANVHELNQRVSETLSAVTGENLGSEPLAWWNWWEQHNELLQSGPRQVAMQYSQTSQSVGYQRHQDRHRLTDIREPQNFVSCFAAGTPVLTNRGDVAIEQLRVGDLVLAQNVETGELAFKPALETTVRPPAEILRIEYEGGSLRATGGHPFWVSGEGWVHARRLESGMELHTPTGTVRVSQVVSDGEEPAYNLIVADFANYFVGEARILSHDNSSRLPTDAIVPGLAQR